MRKPKRANAYLAMFGLTLLVVPVSRAQANETNAEPSETHVNMAKSLFSSGLRAYERRAYGGALRDFTRGYELSGRSAFLFNMAHCLRQLQRFAEAADAYRRFLATGPAPALRKRAEEWLSEMEAKIPRPTPAPESPPPEVSMASGKISPPNVLLAAAPQGESLAPIIQSEPPPVDSNNSHTRTWAIVGGVVAAAIGVGLWAFLRSDSAETRPQGSLATFGEPK